jgi:hypothetical protein
VESGVKHQKAINQLVEGGMHLVKKKQMKKFQ